MMFEQLKKLKATCLPFNFEAKPSKGGARIGGTPPVGVAPATITDETRYFCTLPFDSKELSVFISGDMIDYQQQMLSETTPAVQIILHPPALRCARSRMSSELSTCALAFKQELTDTKDNVVPHHKLGGYPYFIQDTLKNDADRLLAEGWMHLAQFDFPSWKDSIKGTWPFGEVVFHIFLREDNDRTFIYCWG